MPSLRDRVKKGQANAALRRTRIKPMPLSMPPMIAPRPPLKRCGTPTIRKRCPALRST